MMLVSIMNMDTNIIPFIYFFLYILINENKPINLHKEKKMNEHKSVALKQKVCKECRKPSEKDYCPQCIRNIMNKIVQDNS